jgi:hypothetical protein
MFVLSILPSLQGRGFVTLYKRSNHILSTILPQEGRSVWINSAGTSTGSGNYPQNLWIIPRVLLGSGAGLVDKFVDKRGKICGKLCGKLCGKPRPVDKWRFIHALSTGVRCLSTILSTS